MNDSQANVDSEISWLSLSSDKKDEDYCNKMDANDDDRYTTERDKSLSNNA